MTRAAAGLIALALLATAVEAERLPLRTFSSTDGLAGDAVNVLVEDSRGFLWIGTSTGLSRFDGDEIASWGTADGLPHADVTTLLAGRDGTLWAGTWNGLARHREAPGPGESSFEVITLGKKEANVVTALVESPGGEIWVGCRSGLFTVAGGPGRWQVTRVPLPPPPGAGPDPRFETVMSLALDAKGTLYVGTARGLFARAPDGTTSHHSLAPEEQAWDPVRDLEIDASGVLWVAHTFGVFVLRTPLVPSSAPLSSRVAPVIEIDLPWQPPSRAGEAAYLPVPASWAEPRRVMALARGSGGRVWAAAATGLLHFDGVAWQGYSAGHGLRHVVTDVLEDSTGNTWLGTENHGIERIAASGFVSYGLEDGLDGTRIADVFEARDGTLMVYVGGGRQVLHRFDGRRFVPVTPPAHHTVRAYSWGWSQLVLADREGGWWLPTSEGLQRYPAMAPAELGGAPLLHTYGRPEGLPSLDVFRLWEDSRGDFWLGMLQTTTPLARYTRATGHFAPWPLPGNVSLSCPSAFAEDRAGHVWVGLYDGGVVRFDPDGGNARGFPPGGELPGGFVHALLHDRRGRIWVGTSLGLARIDGPEEPAPRVARVVRETGLARDGVRALAEDAQGRLYLGSARGLDRLDPDTGRIESFGTGDGLANSVVQTLFEDHRGQMWVGTLDGLSRFDPSRTRRPVPPRVILTRLTVAGTPQPLAALEPLEIAPGDNRLQVDFAGISLTPQANLRFQTRVVGLDPGWSPPSPNRSVLLAGLPPGAYRFEVRALAGSGELSPTPATVAFRVMPPVWRRGWFLGSAGLTSAGLVWAVRRDRRRRRREIESLRGRIAADLHDDVGASLSRIGVLAEVGKLRLGSPAASEESEASALLGEIGDTSRELSDTMSDIVWALDPGRRDLAGLVSRLRRFASDLLESRGIALEFEAPAAGEALPLSPAESRELFLLLKEAIHNAGRHARPTRVTVRLEVTARRLFAEVVDDGIGLPHHLATAGADCPGHGLRTLRLRADLLGGTLAITSAPGAGTTVRLEARRGTWRRRRPAHGAPNA